MDVKQHFAFFENFAPVQEEVEVSELVPSQGRLPPGLNGVLYRNGPNPQYEPLDNLHHWFLGEGMVHAIHFSSGKVSYVNKWVRTPQFLEQEKLGGRIVPTSFEEIFSGVSDMSPTLSGTNAVWHGDKLYAMDESILPMVLNSETLESEGYTDFDGKYSGPVTAHPKIDPDSGDMIVFGYQVDGPGSNALALAYIGCDGKLKSYEKFNAPVCAMMHDFLTTEEYIVFPLCAATMNVERLGANKPFIAWEPSVGNHIGIMERERGAASMRWFKGPASFVYHPMNGYAYESDGKKIVVADVMQFNSAPLFPGEDGRYDLPWIEKGMAKLVRWTFDLSSSCESYNEEVLCYIEGEFPRIDERFTGKKYTYGFYVARVGRYYKGCSFDTLVKVNVDTGKVQTWASAEDIGLMEPIFVPRAEDSDEADGWIIILGYNRARGASDILVFDANEIEVGPIASVELPVRIPYGFHGSWRNQETLP